MKRFDIQQFFAVAIGVVVIFPAWAYGGTENWAIYLFSLMTLVAFVSALVYCVRRRPHDEHHDEHEGGQCSGQYFVFYPLIAIAGLVIIQLLNPSHRYLPDYERLIPIRHIAWLPSTVAAGLTLNALLLFLSYVAVYWLGSRFLRRKSMEIVAWSVVGSAVCMAVLALLQVDSSGPDKLTGRFLNDNNFAAYINLVMPVTLGLARTTHSRSGYTRGGSSPAALIYFCAGLLVASVLFTGSRAGAAISVMILFLWVFLEWHDLRKSPAGGGRRYIYVAGPLVSVAFLLLLSGIGGWYNQITHPVTALGDVAVTRITVLKDTWNMFLDRWIFGVGAGTFQAVFPYYQDPGVSGFYRNAHNDWLQCLAELGVVGSGLALVAIMPVLKSRAKSPRGKYVDRGIRLGLFGLALHALVDFPFHIPAIAVVAALWAGYLTHRKYPLNHHSATVECCNPGESIGEDQN